MSLTSSNSRLSYPRSRIRPSLLMTLTVVWFMCAFAPAICIVHCQMLARPVVRSTPSAALSSTIDQIASRPTRLTLASAVVDIPCAFIAPLSRDASGLPPISSLPHIISDILPTASLALMLVFSVRRLLSHVLVAWPLHVTRPHAPPPKLHHLA
jgi:hypothetical protein